MSMAIRIHKTGGPEEMSWDQVSVGNPAAGEVRLRHTAVGLNFIDVYHRTGLYPLGILPAVLGMKEPGWSMQSLTMFSHSNQETGSPMQRRHLVPMLRSD